MDDLHKHNDETLPGTPPAREGKAGSSSRTGAAAPDHAPGKRRRGPSRSRVLLWVVEATAVVALIEHVVVRHLRDDETGRSPTRNATRRTAPARGAPVPALADRALALAGLREVTPAYFAPLQGLATGSDAAQQAQALVSREQALPVEVENTIGMRFRLLPPGTSVVGSPTAEQQRWEGEVQHVAGIPAPLYVGMYEVTQRQWQTVMDTNPSHWQAPDRPVEEVTWYDCQRFTVKLCEREGLPLGVYRLPTEKEWEYACRAGTTTAYCFGDDARRLGAYADYAGNNDHATAAVGRRLPNAFGLHDMHGNVWEWCLDLFDRYPGQATPSDPAEGQWRVLRGGNWHSPAKNCRSANRCRLPPLSHGNLLGFRVVRTLPELRGGPAEGDPP